MPSFEGRFFSIVFLGRQNPQILNHDFLVREGVLPRDAEPFRALLARDRDRQFDQFLSTPVMATIQYGPISIIVDEGRYQIRDDRFADPAASPIVDITKKYFGDLLRYTPLKAGGVNLNGAIRFASDAEQEAFERRLGIDKQAMSALVGQLDVRVGLAMSFAWHRGLVEIQLARPRNELATTVVNYNYEFQFSDMDSFLSNLDDVGLVRGRFRELLSSLEVVV